MSTVVLLHGAFRGGWAWRWVAAGLAAHGHEVHAPSLTGAGELAHRRPVDADGAVLAVSLATWVDDVISLLQDRDLTDVTLVGHSQGGVVALAVAGTDASRLARVVLLDSPVPEPGRSAAEVVPADVRAAWGPPPPPEAWLDPMPVGGAEWTRLPERAAWVNARLTSSPARPGYDPLVVTDPRGAEVPRTYLFCARTPATYPSSVSREAMLAAGSPLILLDAGHDAPLTSPDVVVAALLPLLV